MVCPVPIRIKGGTNHHYADLEGRNLLATRHRQEQNSGKIDSIK